MSSIADWFECADCGGKSRTIHHDDGVEIIVDHDPECEAN